MPMHTFFLTLLLLAFRKDDAATIEPAARHVLEAMGRAYRDLHRLDQETTYTMEAGVANGLVRSKLVVERPNHLVLEMYQQTEERTTPYLSRFQCDGKEFYSYQERQGWYTKAKAPKSLKEFDFLAVSLEMAALTGMDPVAPWLKQARAMRSEGVETVDEAPADVVMIDMGSPERVTEVRLYVNQQDHLLRRLTVESHAASSQPPAGSAALPPIAPVRFGYENHVHASRAWTKDAFVWIAPPGAFQYQQYPTFLDPTRGVATLGSTAAAVMPPGIKPMKIISYQDLLKHARKPNQPANK